MPDTEKLNPLTDDDRARIIGGLKRQVQSLLEERQRFLKDLAARTERVKELEAENAWLLEACKSLAWRKEPPDAEGIWLSDGPTLARYVIERDESGLLRHGLSRRPAACLKADSWFGPLPLPQPPELILDREEP